MTLSNQDDHFNPFQSWAAETFHFAPMVEEQVLGTLTPLAKFVRGEEPGLPANEDVVEHARRYGVADIPKQLRDTFSIIEGVPAAP